MKRWDTIGEKRVEFVQVDRFIEDYERLCHTYGMCFAHEDSGGAFIVNRVNCADLAWTRAANIGDLDKSK